MPSGKTLTYSGVGAVVVVDEGEGAVVATVLVDVGETTVAVVAVSAKDVAAVVPG
ncbi:MAG: hypothetical protein PVJ28_09900 [Acidimicrobiia bacterium]|jgi:hypothetical protein